ncbi:MAG: CoA-binding protein, partial [Candidatus Brocadiales bacterium]|nr:CoA-binding protein [Candidatus Brocadiales bacterium]
MLEHFFSPKTVAVVGASRDEGKVGHDLLRNLIKYGYKGKVYPVNPHASNILGIRTYPAIREIQDKIDLAVIVVPASHVGNAVDD